MLQEQDDPHGKLDTDQALVGELYNTYVLNTVLSAADVKKLAENFCDVVR